MEEITNNFQINTVYSDLLSKIHYLSSLPINKKCISFYLFCLLLNCMPELIFSNDYIVKLIDLIVFSLLNRWSSGGKYIWKMVNCTMSNCRMKIIDSFWERWKFLKKGFMTVVAALFMVWYFFEEFYLHRNPILVPMLCVYGFY